MVTELGDFTHGVNIGVATVRSIRIVAHDKLIALISAHSKALGTHDLTAVNHKFLL